MYLGQPAFPANTIGMDFSTWCSRFTCKNYKVISDRSEIRANWYRTGQFRCFSPSQFTTNCEWNSTTTGRTRNSWTFTNHAKGAHWPGLSTRSVYKNRRNITTLHASFCLAFVAFLQCGEFTYTTQERKTDDFDAWHLTRRSITFQEDCITLSLPSSKTDPFRRGVTLTIAEVQDSACAVASLRHLCKYFPEPLSAPLFTTSSGSFTRDYVTSKLRTGLAQLGYTGNYLGHSFRRGAATSAREAGLTDAEIQLLERWKSDAYLFYIQAHPKYILNTSRRFQQLSPI